MKRWMKRAVAISLALTMAFGCCISASAADEDPNRVYGVSAEEGYTLTLWDASDNQITTTTSEEADDEIRDVYKGVVKLKLTFTGDSNEQYVVFLLNGGSTVPTQNNIRYINQQTGSASVEFTIFPDDLTEPGEYTVHLSDYDSYTQVASLTVAEPPYTLGDVDDDGEITAIDAVKTLRAAAKLDVLDDVQQKAADVDKDSELTAIDAVKILRVAAKLETFE